MAWRIHGCARCGGDTYIDKGEYNTWFEQCLQCGYTADLKRVDYKSKTPHSHPGLRTAK